MEDYAIIGKRLPRVDAVDKVTGRTVFGVDVRLPRMLYGKILRSPLPHAKILSIDTSKALRLPGVKAVITGADVPRITFGFFKHLNPKLANRYALTIDKARFVGDEIAAVAAIDEETAEEALELIKVEYEELPAVYDPEEAIKPGAPLIHDNAENNILVVTSVQSGPNVERGFEEADRIFENSYSTQAQAHCVMETHQCVASFDQSGKLATWSSTQMPFFLRKDLAGALGMPMSSVRVHKTFMGGGFGSRIDMHNVDVITALLAKRTGRPVNIVHTRQEEFVGSRTRVPLKINLRTGVKKSGKLTAAEMKVISDSGAYVAHAPGAALVAGQNSMSLYRIPYTSFKSQTVFTNKPFGGAFRGYGNPQGTFAMESQMDTMAEELGLDPLEFRLMNAYHPNDETVVGQKITTCGFAECLREATEEVGWAEKRGKHNKRGVGCGGFFHVGGGARIHGNSDGCGAFVKIEDDGAVKIIVGIQEIGQGCNTVISMIAAEELGVNLEDVTVENTDTDIMPWDIGSHAQRATFIGGNAVRLAAQDAKRQLFEVTAEKLEANPEDLVARDRKIFVKGSPERSLSISEAAYAHHYRYKGSQVLGRGFYDPPTEEPTANGGGNKSATYSFGLQTAEVEVDTETGQVKVLQLAAACDVGKSINPMALESQIEGAVAMGIGLSLTEQVVWENGQTVNNNLADYKIQMAPDLPVIKPIAVETNDPEGPFGAKGTAEAGLVPTAPAIANAIYDAVGVRITDLPITPDKVLKALREKGQKA